MFGSALSSVSLALTAVLLVGGSMSASAAPLRVVATTSMVADLVKQVGGPGLQVDGLMGPGVDPHLYKPSASDVTKLQKAQVIFYNGLLLEGRMSDLFERLARGGKKVFAVTAAIPESDLLKPQEFEGHFDPHVWGDARLWALCADAVVKGLSEADPAGAAEYAKRGAALKAELAKLHDWAVKRAQEVPEARRILITSHDAFNYLGRAYGFQVVGVQGISTVSEAGLADVAKVVDFIRQKQVKAIFVESSVPRAAIERIAQDSGAKVGGELFSDAMGTPGTLHTVAGETYDEGTFVGMLKHNINTVVEALK
jgi:manganese/zinc/iron transport system substrate-binding protein